MATALLSFNLPEEQEEFDIHTKAMDTYGLLLELREHIRARLKHSEIGDELRVELVKIQQFLYEI